MKTRSLFVLLFMLATQHMTAEEAPSLNTHLEPLRPLLNKTWQGAFSDSKPDKPMLDVARWERALNGQAIRMLHSVNQGVYGGETLFVWDETKQKIAYYYFTTAGYMTTGTLSIQERKFVSSEEVRGDATGVTEVRSTCELLASGAFHVKAEYLKNGAWTPGHEITYHEDSRAAVVYK